MTDGELFLATVDQLDGYRVESYHGVISSEPARSRM